MINYSVHRRACFDHHHGYARFFQRRDEFLQRARGLNVFSFGASGREFFGNFSCAIKYRDRKAFRFHVKDEIFAHNAQADQANITLIRCHFDISFLTELEPIS